MRVGIIGIPGVGKSKLTTAVLAKKLSESNHGIPQRIDEYVNDISHDIQSVVDYRSSYVVNFMVAMARERLEAYYQDRDTLTCGTILDTIAYSAYVVDSLIPLADANPRVQAKLQREVGGLQMLTLIFQDTWRYDKVFYLPIPKAASLIVPGASKPFSDELVLLDNHIQDVISKLNLTVDTLDGTFDENVERVFECFSQSKSSPSVSESSSSTSQVSTLKDQS